MGHGCRLRAIAQSPIPACLPASLASRFLCRSLADRGSLLLHKVWREQKTTEKKREDRYPWPPLARRHHGDELGAEPPRAVPTQHERTDLAGRPSSRSRVSPEHEASPGAPEPATQNTRAGRTRSRHAAVLQPVNVINVNVINLPKQADMSSARFIPGRLSSKSRTASSPPEA